MKIDLWGALRGSREVSKAASSTASTRAGTSPSQFVPVNGLNQTVSTDWNDQTASREGFKACSWVYACVDTIARNASMVPWRLLERSGKRGIGKGEWAPQDGSPYEMAIERPNEIMSRQFLMHVWGQWLGIGGNSLGKVITVSRRPYPEPREIWPMFPRLWKPIADEARWIAGYKRTDKPYEPQLRVDQVIHVQYPDPDNLLWGLSPMRAISRTIDMDVDHVRWNAALPKNRMTPEVAIIDKSLRSTPQLEEATNRIAERYSGAEMAGRPMVLGDGAQVLRLGMTPQEMAWIESRRFSLIEICAAYGLIPSLFVPDAKYANQDVAVKYMWQNGVTRVLETIQDALNTRLIPFELRTKFWIHYDTSGISAMGDSLAARLEAHERAVRSFVPPNESFLIFDIPCHPIEDGDKPLGPMNLVPHATLFPDPDAEVPDPLDKVVPAADGKPEDTAPGSAPADPAAADAQEEAPN